MNFVRRLFSTPAGKQQASIEADLFQQEGPSWTSLSDDVCTVDFEESSLVVACEDEGVRQVFPVDKMTRFERYLEGDPEEGCAARVCFEWKIQGKGKETFDSYVLRFVTEDMAAEFQRKFAVRAQEAAEILAQAEVDFQRYDRVDKSWVPAAEEETTMATISQRGDLEAFFTVSGADAGSVKVNERISNQLHMQWNLERLCAIFACNDEAHSVNFTSEAEFKLLKASYDRSLAESVARARVDLGDVMDQFAALSEDEESESEDPDVWEDPDEYEDSPIKSRRGATRAKNRAQFLQIGKSNHRAFVCKRTDKGDSVVEAFNLANVSDAPLRVGKCLNAKGKAIKPQAGMIHAGDRQLLMINQDDDKVHCLDLESEKVVRTFDADNLTVANMFPVSKFAQQEGEQTFLAMNSRSAFVMDPRSEGTHRVRTHSYASKPQLSCLATDEHGHFVLGSQLGEFRLFDGQANKDGELKRCKTMLNGLGDPLKALDVTADGNWVLGTTDKYLVVVRTGKGEETGFVGRGLSASTRQQRGWAPIKLQVKLEDLMQHGLGGASFTAAHFDANEKGEKEARIVTSLGSVAVVWDFRKVKQGKPTYAIKKMEDYIVATDLVSKKVVVAYDDGIALTSTAK